MHVLVEVGGGGVVSLHGWLRADRELARHADATARAGVDPTAMGALEVIDVALSHATGVTGLALSVLAWRQSRSRPGPVTLTRPDGRTLTIGGAPTVTSDLIIAFLSGGDPTVVPGPGGTHRESSQPVDGPAR